MQRSLGLRTNPARLKVFPLRRLNINITGRKGFLLGRGEGGRGGGGGDWRMGGDGVFSTPLGGEYRPSPSKTGGPISKPRRCRMSHERVCLCKDSNYWQVRFTSILIVHVPAVVMKAISSVTGRQEQIQPAPWAQRLHGMHRQMTHVQRTTTQQANYVIDDRYIPGTVLQLADAATYTPLIRARNAKMPIRRVITCALHTHTHETKSRRTYWQRQDITTIYIIYEVCEQTGHFGTRLQHALHRDSLQRRRGIYAASRLKRGALLPHRIFLHLRQKKLHIFVVGLNKRRAGIIS